MKYGATLARGQISEANDLGSRLRSRTLRMTFVLFWLPQTVYATALCLAMNSANDPSVIYPSVCTKAAPVAPSGLRDDLGAVPSGGGSPKSAFGQTLMENHEKWMELCAPSIQGTRPGKAPGAHSRNRAPASRKRAAGERNPSRDERTRTACN